LAGLPVPWQTAVAAAAGHRAGASYVTSVRIGQHGSFDRLVLTFHGPVPAYRVSYVKAVHSDPSGRVVRLEGEAKLRLVVHPTSTTAHPPQGTWTPRLPEIRQVKGAGNFEGYTSYGVGVAAHRPFRAFTLRSPSRLVIDVSV
jgi:hypothetical protein